MAKSIMDSVVEEQTERDRVEAARNSYAQRVAQFRQRGYDVSRLVRVLDSDPMVRDQTFAAFESDVRQLYELNQRLHRLDLRDFEHAYQDLSPALGNPDRLPEVRTRVEALEQAVAQRATAARANLEAQQKLAAEHADIARAIADFRARGYITTRLDTAMGAGGPPKARELLPAFKADLQRCWELLEELRRIDLGARTNEATAIATMLRDPDRLAEASAALSALKDALTKERGADKLYLSPDQQVAAAAMVAAANRVEAAEAAGNSAEAQRNAVLKAKVWLAELAKHQQGFGPQYSPAGYWLGDKRWTVVTNGERLEVIGKAPLSFLKDHLVVRTSWADASYFGSAKGTETYLQWAAQQYAKDGLYGVECFVLEGAAPEVVGFIERWQNPALAVFLYDQRADKLHGNGSDLQAGYFRPWFILDATPTTLQDLIAKIEDKNGIFYEKDLSEKLGMRADEVRRMLGALEKDHTVFQVSRTDGSWSFA